MARYLPLQLPRAALLALVASVCFHAASSYSHPVPTGRGDPLIQQHPRKPLPVVIWHGLGDSYTNPGLNSLAEDIKQRYPGTFVHLINVAEGGSADQRATFFGNANDQVAAVCEQLANKVELSDGFDAIGLSQGGQFFRAYVERCNAPPVRNLVTVGSQHLGVSAMPDCRGPTDFLCNLMKRLTEGGAVYSSYAQHSIIPAQYFRDQANIEQYLEHNEFLRDINNEQLGDDQPDFGDTGLRAKRNETYKTNFGSLGNFVMFKFSDEKTVIPATSAWFTLPNVTASFPAPAQPIPLPLSSIPLYSQDYIGLKKLDEEGRVRFGECQGEHMQINGACWEDVLDWVGTGRRMPSVSVAGWDGRDVDLGVGAGEGGWAEDLVIQGA